MADTDTTAPDAQAATAAPDQPQAGHSDTAATTTATASTDQASKDSAELDRLKAELADTRKEAAKYRTAAKRYEDEKLSDTERLQQQAKDADERAKTLETQLRQERGRAAITEAAVEQGIKPALAYRLVDLKWAEDGTLETDVKKALAQAVRDLGIQTGAGSSATTNGARTAPGSGESDADRRRRLLT